MAWELVKHTRTPAGIFYVGRAEVATFDITLPPEELPGTSWFAEQITDALIESAAGEGVILETKVYFDPGSWLDCKYRVVVAAHASPLAWAVVILAALIVIGLGMIAWILQSVEDKPWLGIGIIGLGIGAGAFGIGYLLKSRPAKGGT